MGASDGSLLSCHATYLEADAYVGLADCYNLLIDRMESITTAPGAAGSIAEPVVSPMGGKSLLQRMPNFAAGFAAEQPKDDLTPILEESLKHAMARKAAQRPQ
jgi:hypothetical protein